MTRLPLIWTLAVGLAGAVHAAPDETPALLKGADGAQLGTIMVTEAPKGVLVRIEAEGLPPGWHGVHFHETGTCADKGFKASGAHVHSTAASEDGKKLVHGLRNPDANDSGDLPNIYVHMDGTLKVELYSTLVALHDGTDRPALKDSDGAALVIHANPDDHQSQPIGGAGDRIACAVIP